MTVVMSKAPISLNLYLLFCFATDHKKEYSNAVCEGRWSHLSLTTITCWTLKSPIWLLSSKNQYTEVVKAFSKVLYLLL